VLLFPLYWILLTSVLPTRVILSRTPPLLPPRCEKQQFSMLSSLMAGFNRSN